jgi:hypothetical protein
MASFMMCCLDFFHDGDRNGHLSEPIGPIADLTQDFVETGLGSIVESGAFGEGLCVLASGLGIGQDKGLVFGDIGLVALAKALSLVRPVSVAADEGLHFGTPEQAVDIVIVPHEVEREFFRRLLLAEFR